MAGIAALVDDMRAAAPGPDRRHAGAPGRADRRTGRSGDRCGAPLPQARPGRVGRATDGRTSRSPTWSNRHRPPHARAQRCRRLRHLRPVVLPVTRERCRAVLLISQGIGAKLIINGDVEMQMPMEIGNFVLHENGAPASAASADASRRPPVPARSSSGSRRSRYSRRRHRVRGRPRRAARAARRPATAVFRTAGRDLARGIATVQVIANPSSWAIYGPASLVTKSTRASDAYFGSLEDFDKWVSYDAYQDSPIRRRPDRR